MYHFYLCLKSIENPMYGRQHREGRPPRAPLDPPTTDKTRHTSDHARTTTILGTGHRVIAVRGAGAGDVRGDVLETEPEQELEPEGQVNSATGVY